MNKNDPLVKAIAATYFTRMRSQIQDVVQTHPDGVTKSRYRHAMMILNQQIIQESLAQKFPFWDVYEDVLEMIAAELKQGFGSNAVSLEEFDHQARDWTMTKLNELYTGTHPWCTLLKEHPDYTVVVGFGFGSVAAATDYGDNRLALLPHVYFQLCDYGQGGDNEPAPIVDTQSWNVQDNGVALSPDLWKQFGRPDDDEG